MNEPKRKLCIWIRGSRFSNRERKVSSTSSSDVCAHINIPVFSILSIEMCYYFCLTFICCCFCCWWYYYILVLISTAPTSHSNLYIFSTMRNKNDVPFYLKIYFWRIMINNSFERKIKNSARGQHYTVFEWSLLFVSQYNYFHGHLLRDWSPHYKYFFIENDVMM